jgi:hypothetical protein
MSKVASIVLTCASNVKFRLMFRLPCVGFCPMHVDGTGSAYVTGYTTSPDFPTQMPFEPTLQAHYNAFVSKLTVVNTAISFMGSSETGTSPFTAG